jgi:periplasmic protein TonB
MSAATSHTLSDFYRWGFPGAPIQIHLGLEVVTEIRKQIQESGKDAGALSGCGLLTGDTRKAGITRILSFQPLQTLDAASVEAARSSASGEVVGFYRTTPISGVAMPDPDRALAASLFRQPASVFLLIETGKSGIGGAHFGFWGDDQLFDWPLMVFPFDAEELAAEEERRRSSKIRELSQSSSAGLTQVPSPMDKEAGATPAVEPVTVLAPPAVAPVVTQVVTQVVAPEPLPVLPVADRVQGPPAPVPLAAKPRETRRRWLVPALAIVSVSALVGASLYLLYFRRGVTQPAGSQALPVRVEGKATLGLAVERRGNDLRVSWNGNAALIAKADFGMLLIRGSQVSRDVPLTAEELRSGSVVYASSVDEVRFQLNVVAGEQVTREFLTVVLPSPGESRAIVTSAKSIPSAPAGQPQPKLLSGSETAKELRQFKPVEDRVPATATPLRLEEPPSVSAAPPVNSGTPTMLNQALNQPLVAAPAAPTAKPEAPAQRASQTEPPLTTVGANPPVATNKVIPPVPPLLKGVLWKPVVVEVKISVNESGNVAKAEAVPKPGVNPLLSDAAVQAARRWKFRPAQFDGHPVPAEVILQFSFAGGK